MSKSNSMRLAQFLMAHPKITAKIFQISADGVSMKEMPEILNQRYSSMDGAEPFTQWNVRNILHRYTPFDHPKVYSEVNSEHEDVIKLRFKKQVKRPRKKKDVPENRGARVASRNELLTAASFALHRLNEARDEFNSAVEAAVDAGMDRSSVIAMAELTADVTECNGG